MQSSLRIRFAIVNLARCLVLGVSPALFAATNQPVYSDSLQGGWADWSWAAVDRNNASPVHQGTASIRVTASAWQALYLHNDTLQAGGLTNLSFWINGGTGAQIVQVQATRGNQEQAPVVLQPLPANAWRLESIPLSALGVAQANDFDGFWIQVQETATPTTFYIDDIVLLGGSNAPPQDGTNAQITVALDAGADLRPINPLIYGVAFASSNELALLNAPLNRSGGNAETRYNWRDNVRNHASDWYFQSLEAGPASPGEAADSHVSESRDGGAEAMLTVPMIGWMPKLGPNRQRLSSYSIAKYGPQTDRDWQWFPDAGNGVGTNLSTGATWLITTNDPNDAHFQTNSAFQQAWIQHLTNRWGLATNGGVRFYCMDNEHTLWNSTHRDVHPAGTTMQEIRDKFFEYGTMVKSVDRGALLLAPEEWGWSGYLYSGFDAAWATANNNWNPAAFPDRNANGGMDYMPWFLDQARQQAVSTGQRLLDYFTLHIYPQGGEYGNNTSTAMQLRRNRSTRALWDTNYVDETWINAVVRLIPRMREWVTAYYPGTKIGITEYNWGAEHHINGATAQADVFGIFGREGLDLATRWTTPAVASPTFKAMQMYRNYDGNRSGFGDVSIRASVPNPDQVSVFAALRQADGALTVMAINKQIGSNTPVRFALTNHSPAGIAEVWQLTAANSIARLGNIPVVASGFTSTVPAQSVTLFVIPRSAAAPVLTAPTLWNDGQFRVVLHGSTGTTYQLQASTDLMTWTEVQTITLTNGATPMTLLMTNDNQFFRAAMQ
ncbi:MAG TPA: glycoside hydrolase family 44 protein [Verrucomicrobiae bacterium]|nr:glycoside hydrolase family 44 protein [Verrucomicrobiae bacterium]